MGSRFRGTDLIKAGGEQSDVDYALIVEGLPSTPAEHKELARRLEQHPMIHEVRIGRIAVSLQKPAVRVSSADVAWGHCAGDKQPLQLGAFQLPVYLAPHRVGPSLESLAFWQIAARNSLCCEAKKANDLHEAVQAPPLPPSSKVAIRQGTGGGLPVALLPGAARRKGRTEHGPCAETHALPHTRLHPRAPAAFPGLPGPADPGRRPDGPETAPWARLVVVHACFKFVSISG